jgi:hypothetical protein
MFHNYDSCLASRPCCLSMLHVHYAARTCCMNMKIKMNIKMNTNLKMVNIEMKMKIKMTVDMDRNIQTMTWTQTPGENDPIYKIKPDPAEQLSNSNMSARSKRIQK